MSIAIHTTDLVKKYRARTVVNKVSIEVKQGEIVGLLGPNGAGKTTTFYMTVGLIRPDSGEVYLNNQNITKLPMYKRAKMGIGYLPQEASVFRKLSVEDNITAVLEMTDLPRQEQKDRLESLIDEFRLQHVRRSNGDVLSGGERRRTEIARALAVDPKFILLDEPFAGIDPIAVEDIQSIVAKLKFRNIGILITDHNVTETLSICDRAYLLIEGKIFKHGTAEELAMDDQVKKLYLGKNFELKRKDFIYEENLNPEQATIEAIIRSLEWGIHQLTKMEQSEGFRTRFLPKTAGAQKQYREQLEDYNRRMSDTFQFIVNYSEQSSDESFRQRIEMLLTGGMERKGTLQNLIDYLKNYKDAIVS
ncbi:MAG: LPS export ABC transporter ATP-binding protein [Flavisolibacter sp.]